MKIGLALSGGGARGFAHIGVLQVLVENGIPIDLIVGTSAGSFVGAAFAAGMTPDEIAAISVRARWSNFVRPSLSPMGMLSSAPIGSYIEREFPVARIEECLVVYAAVVDDLLSGEELLITSGDIAHAVRASCTVPGVFAPVSDENGRLLVDGGATSPVPIDAARRMGADVVIAVDLLACGATFNSRPRTAFGVMFRSAMTLVRTASRAQKQAADVTIEPRLAHLRPDDIKPREEFIRLGREAAEEKISAIRELVA